MTVLPLAQHCSYLHRNRGFAVTDRVQGALGGPETAVLLLRAERGCLRWLFCCGGGRRLLLLVLLLCLREDRVRESGLDCVRDVGLPQKGSCCEAPTSKTVGRWQPCVN